MPDFSVILVEPAFEESIGFVARSMKNFGLTSLHLVNPKTALGPSGRARGGHAQDVLDSIVTHASLTEALDGLDLTIGTTAQRAHSGTSLLRRPMTPRELGNVLQCSTGSVGVVLGREGTGLNNGELGMCDAVVTIPSSAEYPTLNLSHAAAIIFYELHLGSLSTEEEELATGSVKETILRYLSDSLILSRTEEYRVGLTARALRNVLGRSAIRKREASLLAGALRSIAEALSVAAPAVSVSEIVGVRLRPEEGSPRLSELTSDARPR